MIVVIYFLIQVKPRGTMTLKTSEDEIGKQIVDSAFKVHQTLGPGLLEKIYERCMVYELETRGLKVARQTSIPIQYGNITFDEGLRLDLLVEDSVIIEIKAAEKANSLWQAQLLSYLRLSDNKLGYLINFNTPLFKQSIKRFVL